MTGNTRLRYASVFLVFVGVVGVVSVSLERPIIKRIMQLYIEEFAQCLQTMTRDTKHQRELNSGEKAQRQ